MVLGPNSVLDFWFGLPREHWFAASDTLDADIRVRFGDLHSAAAACELSGWRSDPGGRLAEIIVLDQFSRNLFRGDARGFATDALALVLAQEAVAAGVDIVLPDERCAFLYMPFMHSESTIIQEASVALFAARGLSANIEFAQAHRTVIEQFGRFPHRNAMLGRKSTPEELVYINTPGSGF